MYFVIRDNNNTMWAYGHENGINPSLMDICKYLLSSCSKPDIFTLTFFDNTGITKEVPLIDYIGG